MKIECKKCGYVWEARKPNPKCCPKCKSYNFDKPPVWKDIVKEGKS